MYMRACVDWPLDEEIPSISFLISRVVPVCTVIVWVVHACRTGRRGRFWIIASVDHPILLDRRMRGCRGCTVIRAHAFIHLSASRHMQPGLLRRVSQRRIRRERMLRTYDENTP